MIHKVYLERVKQKKKSQWGFSCMFLNMDFVMFFKSTKTLYFASGENVIQMERLVVSDNGRILFSNLAMQNSLM